MKLNDVSFDVSECESVCLKHPSAEGVELNISLRNPLGFGYKKAAGAAYSEVYKAFTDRAEAKIIIEAVCAIDGWDIDDKECNLENMIELFSDSKYEWIAISVYDRVMAKKLLGMKI